MSHCILLYIYQLTYFVYLLYINNDVKDKENKYQVITDRQTQSTVFLASFI